MTKATISVDVAIFAHQEEDHIATTLHGLAGQDAFGNSSFDIRVSVLANGCTDATVERARETCGALPPAVAGKIRIEDLAPSGKCQARGRAG